MKIFLVEKISFDNMENQHSDARIRRVVGYARTADAASSYVVREGSKLEHYRGWDGETYPQFRVTEVEEIG